VVVWAYRQFGKLLREVAVKYRWYFHLRGQVYAYGPVGPMTRSELLEYLRETWGNGKRVPYGTQIWRSYP
jgi:hypothetical protein